MKRSMKPLVALVAGLLLGGCAHDPDLRASHDNTFGSTAKSPPDYLRCVKSELPDSAKPLRCKTRTPWNCLSRAPIRARPMGWSR
jgi:hypothetical protein